MTLDRTTLAELLEGIAAKTPTPGGGAVAAVVGAVAAALGRMVINYSIGRKALAQFDADHRQALTELQRLGEAAMTLAAEDAVAYARLNALWKLDDDDPQRRKEWNDAVAASIDAPMRLMQVCLDIVHLQILLVRGVNALLRSDWAIAALLAHAAAQAAMWNVRVNLPLMDDRDRALELETDAAILLGRVEINRKEIEEACAREQADQGNSAE